MLVVGPARETGERGGFWASAGKVVELHLYKEARAGLPAAAGKLESWRGPGPCTEATKAEVMAQR